MTEDTSVRLQSLEDKFTSVLDFLKEFKNLPTTLALIQKDISLNAGLAKEVQENTNDINSLKSWRAGTLLVITVISFFFGYIVSMIEKNLELSMKETARKVVVEELSKYNVIDND